MCRSSKTLACAFFTLEKNFNPEQWTLQKGDFPPMQIVSIIHNGMNSSFYPYSFCGVGNQNVLSGWFDRRSKQIPLNFKPPSGHPPTPGLPWGGFLARKASTNLASGILRIWYFSSDISPTCKKFFWLVVEPTHLKNISQNGNLWESSPSRGENKKIFETTT